MGISRAKTISFDLHLEVELQCMLNVAQYLHETGIEYIYYTGGMCYGYSEGLSCLKLISGGIKISDVISRQGSVD